MNKRKRKKYNRKIKGYELNQEVIAAIIREREFKEFFQSTDSAKLGTYPIILRKKYRNA